MLRVLDLRPGHEDARRGLIEIHIRNKNPRKALPVVERYVADYPERYDMLVPYARCQRAAGQTQAARASLQKLLDREPENPSAKLLLAQLDADEGKPEAAFQHLRDIEGMPLADNEEINTAANLRITMARQLGLEAEAVAAEKRLVQLNQDLAAWNDVMNQLRNRPPNNAERFELGRLALRIGSERQGRYWLEGLMQEAPAERERVLKELLSYYETRKDHAGRQRAGEIRRELGVPSR
jgi:lipopolysaccharide biosynthesis regulator YciM